MEDIKLLAEAVAETYWGDGCFDIETVLSEKEIDLYEDEFGNEFDGVLEYADRKFSIFLNLDRGNSYETERGRYTLGHELGHFFIDEHRQPMEQGKLRPHPSKILKSDSQIEREADWFSSNLLMPEERFKKAAKKNKGFLGIKKLGNKFKTSWTATAIRYVKTVSPDSALILWRDGISQWCITSEAYYLSMYKGKTAYKAPRGSVTEELLRSSTTGDIQSKGTLLSEWKPRIPTWSTRNDILIEEALCLGNYGVLTLLRPDINSSVKISY